MAVYTGVWRVAKTPAASSRPAGAPGLHRGHLELGIEPHRRTGAVGLGDVGVVALCVLLDALDGRFIRPAPGGDLVRSPQILPTGRNIHGFDPFLLPSPFACRMGSEQAEQLIARIDTEGKVQDAMVLAHTNQRLADTALAAVRGWRPP